MTRPVIMFGLLTGSMALAQGGTPAPSAVHAQAVPADRTAPLEAHVLLPPPTMPTWDEVTTTSDASCLVPTGVREPPEEAAGANSALTLLLAVRGSSGSGLEPGESCTGTVVLRFSGDGVTEQISVVANFHRPASPPYTGPDLVTTYSLDRVSLAPIRHAFGHLLELRLTNEGEEALEVIGLSHLEVLSELLAGAYVIDGDAAVTTLEGLEPLGDEPSLPLPAGGTVRIGIVFGDEPLPGRGVTAVQPAVIVEQGEERFSVRFGLIVTATGVELP